jgi:hypothetical protein
MGGLEFHPYFHLTQVAHDVTTYPPGVGRSLAASDVIRLNMHYLNTTTASQQSNAEVTVRYTDAKAVAQLAAEVFIYGGSLRVPVGQSTQMFSYTAGSSGDRGMAGSRQAGPQSSMGFTTSFTANGFDVVALSMADAGGSSPALQDSDWYPMEPQTNPLTVSLW